MNDELDVSRLAIPREEGILFSSEGAASYLGLILLISEETNQPNQRIVLVDTASRLKFF